jgi:PGF-CTERM protein
MQFTRSSNSDLFAMDSDADEQQLRAIGGMVDALVLYQTHDPAMAAGFSRIVDLVVRSSTNGYSPNMTVETPLKSCPIDFIENIDLENDEALLRYEIVDVKVEESNNSTVTDDTTVSDDDNDEGFLPGFGFLSTLVSLVGVAILLQRKQRVYND